MRRSALWLWLWLMLPAGLALAPAPALAGEDDDDEEEFETTWVGARLGIWYRPEMDMTIQVSGNPPGGGPTVPGTRFNLEDDLGVTQSPTSDYMFDQGILQAEVFLDTRFLSVSGFLVAPWEYKGTQTLTQDLSFAGVTFQANGTVTSRWRQTFGGIDVKVNLLNNKFIRLSPVIGARLLGVDWELEGDAGGGLTIKVDTSDIGTPLELNDLQLLPYPELGAEVRVGLRRWFEVDLRVSGTYVNYWGFLGSSLTVDGGVTVTPIPWIGVRLGLRYVEFDFAAKGSEQQSDFFDFDLKYFGFTLGIMARF